MNKYKLITFIAIFTLNFLHAQTEAQKKTSKIKTLIIDGQNNHYQWPKITFMIKEYLEESNLFTVDVARSAYTWKGDNLISEFSIDGLEKTEALEKPKADPNFKPKFSKYDLVICNFGWNAAVLPEKTKKSLEKFIKKGGGLVVFHAADNSFPEWTAYNEMIGLGGWGKRSEKDGPYVYYKNDELIRDTTPGPAGSHGPQEEFQIQIRNTEHPITKGMPLKWMHTKDELYSTLRGPAKNMTVLATAYASQGKKATERDEPVLMTINYGKGRVFHSTLGHVDYSVECVGFITTMLRGSEWAATGKVTIPIPEDFPKENEISKRKFIKKQD